MSVTNQFSDDASTVKRQIEATYDDGEDDVHGDGRQAGTHGSPLCVVDQ